MGVWKQASKIYGGQIGFDKTETTGRAHHWKCECELQPLEYWLHSGYETSQLSISERWRMAYRIAVDQVR